MIFLGREMVMRSLPVARNSRIGSVWLAKSGDSGVTPPRQRARSVFVGAPCSRHFSLSHTNYRSDCYRPLALVLALLIVIPVANAQNADLRVDRVEGDFGNDHFTAGGNVTVNKPVSGDVFAVGGDVEVATDVDGDVVAAGGNLRLGGRA